MKRGLLILPLLLLSAPAMAQMQPAPDPEMVTLNNSMSAFLGVLNQYVTRHAASELAGAKKLDAWAAICGDDPAKGCTPPPPTK